MTNTLELSIRVVAVIMQGLATACISCFISALCVCYQFITVDLQSNT